MKNTMRAWKESTYRQSLLTEGQTTPCSNPTGRIELTDAELDTICGGQGSGLLDAVKGLTSNLPLVGDLTSNLPLVGDLTSNLG